MGRPLVIEVLLLFSRGDWGSTRRSFRMVVVFYLFFFDALIIDNSTTGITLLFDSDLLLMLGLLRSAMKLFHSTFGMLVIVMRC